MNPAVALTRVQLWSLLVGMGGRKRTRRRWSVAALVSVVAVATVALSTVYSVGLAAVLSTFGAVDLILVIMPILAAVGALSAGTFGVSRSVLGGTDDTLLLGLPVRPRTIALGKLAAVALQNALLMELVVIPGGVVYALQVPVRPWYWPALVGGALALALAVTAVSVVLALLLLFAPRSRGRTAVNLLILVFTAALSLSSVPVVQHLQHLLAGDPEAAGRLLRRWATGFMAVRDLAVDGSPAALGILLLLGCVPFAAVTWLVSATYVRLIVGRADTATPVARRVDIAAMGARSPFSALLRREAHRFFTSTVYVVNNGFGMIMLLVGAGWLIVSGGLPDGVRGLAAGVGVPLPVLAAIALSFPVSMTCTTAPSISLEGDRLWLLRAAPIDPLQVLAAKAALNLLVVLPALLPVAVVLAVATGAGALEGALILLVAALVGLVVAELGLVTNLLWPVLDAPNDAVVVKQSVSVLVALFAGFAGCVLLSVVGVVAAMAAGTTPALLVMAMVVGATALGFLAILRGWGVRRFARLG